MLFGLRGGSVQLVLRNNDQIAGLYIINAVADEISSCAGEQEKQLVAVVAVAACHIPQNFAFKPLQHKRCVNLLFVHRVDDGFVLVHGAYLLFCLSALYYIIRASRESACFTPIQ